ncbi:flagellar hook-length control protein FliK [Cedecea neteri]|uniref:flagellar hook-length control protein FliK n=1 Tax=Cedecea neteri TaxID=158822 RepID=UPI002899222E|nr:flagellar hook-length control protein FliK [Cedecea neteri]
MMKMVSSPLGQVDTPGALADLQNIVTSQSITIAASGSQPAVLAQSPFTLSMLSVMQTGPGDDAGLDATGTNFRESEEEASDSAVKTEAPVMLLQQILDNLLAASAAPASPVNAAANLMADATTAAPVEKALFSSVSLPGANLPTQAQAPALTDAGAIPLIRPMTVKEGEFAAPLTVLHTGENRVISTVQPASAGYETKSSPATLKLDPEPSRWAQQLQSALGERLQVQVKDQIQHATIRLDPPEMGKIDIVVQIENGRVQVSINASQGEVYRALQQVSNDLRQSLTEQNFVQVNVQVSSQGGQRDGQQQPASQKQPQDVMAAMDFEAEATQRREDASVLLTV